MSTATPNEIKRTDVAFNLLTDPLITVLAGGVRRAMTLPETLAALAGDVIDDFPRLRPHHRHAWHMFLCQLAAIALAKGGRRAIPADVSDWLHLIRALTPEYPGDEPWCLIVGDVAMPAFMQAPADGEFLTDFAGTFVHREDCHDDLDLLVTSRNHGIKRSRHFNGRPEDWMFVLIALQTLSKYAGRDNYGVARMSSGYSGRPFVGLTPSLRPGRHFARDLSVMLRHRDGIAQTNGLPAEGGLALLWAIPWDGHEQIVPSRLDPWFIEIARAVRLNAENDHIYALRAGTKHARINAGDGKVKLKGLIGDPWAPLDNGKGAMLNPPADMDHSYIARVLFDRRSFVPSLLQATHPEDEGAEILYVVFRTICGGEGETTWNEFIVPVPGRVVFEIGAAQQEESVGTAIRDFLGDIQAITWNVLRPALKELIDANERNEDTAKAQTRMATVMRQMDRRVGAMLFPALWDHISGTNERKVWISFLKKAALDTLEDAFERLPASVNRRRAAIAAAEIAFGQAFAETFRAWAPAAKENVDD